MAWNDNPFVRDLAKYGEDHGFIQCVIVGIKADGSFAVATWGKTKQLCEYTKALGGVCEKAVIDFYS